MNRFKSAFFLRLPSFSGLSSFLSPFVSSPCPSRLSSAIAVHAPPTILPYPALQNAPSDRGVFSSNQSPCRTTQFVRCYHSYMRLTRRCKDCFFIMREGRLHVECRKFPKHKQRHMFRIQEAMRNRKRKLLFDNFFAGPHDQYPTYDVTQDEMTRYVSRSMVKVNKRV